MHLLVIRKNKEVWFQKYFPVNQILVLSELWKKKKKIYEHIKKYNQ